VFLRTYQYMFREVGNFVGLLYSAVGMIAKRVRKTLESEE
jgi:hypothetical protein